MNRDWSWPVFIIIVVLFIGVLMNDRGDCGPAGRDEYGCDEELGEHDDGPF